MSVTLKPLVQCVNFSFSFFFFLEQETFWIIRVFTISPIKQTQDISQVIKLGMKRFKDHYLIHDPIPTWKFTKKAKQALESNTSVGLMFEV